MWEDSRSPDRGAVYGLAELLGALVEASDLFTPADIEFAARNGSQRALGSAVYGEKRRCRVWRADHRRLHGRASGDTATLTKAIVEELTEDIETTGRL